MLDDRQRFFILALPVLFLAFLPALGADERASTAPVPTVTRLVKIFLEKEAALTAAVREGDAYALGALLADDFELRAATRAAKPVARADWMKEVLGAREGGLDIAGMAVHDLGAVAIASFTQDGARGR